MNRKFFRCWLLAVVIGTLGLSGCQSPLPAEPPANAWTPSQLENMLAGSDPIEPFNRCMFSVQDFVMCWIVDPLGRVYTSIFPRPFIKHFNNVCVNLEFPAHCFSNLLCAKWGPAGDDALRFLANTTLGIAGIFDVAEAWWQIYPSGSTFGQTFSTWGVDPGCTFILPFVGQSNVRDTGGALFDAAFDLKTWIPYAGYATVLNRAVVAHKAYDALTRDSADPYKDYRQLGAIYRELQQRMWFYNFRNQAATYQKMLAEHPEKAPKYPPTPSYPKPDNLQGVWHDNVDFGECDPLHASMRAVLFKPQDNDSWWFMKLALWNNDFSNRREKRKIELNPDLPKFTYAYWESPLKKAAEKADIPEEKRAPARLAIVLPGIGGNWHEQSPQALADILNRENFAVAIVDSTFSWQFLEATAPGQLPGYLVRDAETLRGIIAKVVQDLRADGKKLEPEITLVGYSFGAMHLLKIADLERTKPQLKVRRYVAINPPVSLRYASKVADTYAKSGANWQPQKAVNEAVDLAGSMLVADAMPPEAAKHSKLFQPRLEPARVIAGLYLRNSLRDLVLTAHKFQPLPQLSTPYEWGRRNALYLEIDQLSFKDYAEKLLAPQFPEVPVTELYRRSDLRSIQETLQQNPEIRILHNYDDILLSDSDKAFLDQTLKQRMHWFSRGGHLGNLYTPEVQKVIGQLASEK